MALSPIDAFDLIKRLDAIPAGIGDWVANGTPNNPVAQAVQQRYRDQCDSYSNAPAWFKAGVQLAPTASRTMANLCDPWLESQGSGGPIAETPFEGGQCAGVEYQVRYRRNSYQRIRCDNGSSSTIAIDNASGAVLFGPIRGLRREDVNFGDCGPDSVIMYLDGFDEDGNPKSVNIWSAGLNGSAFSVGAIDIEIFEVNRLDGQPDDCGNPGVEPAPNPNPRPDPGLQPEDEPYVDPVFGTPRFPMPSVENPFGEPIPIPPTYDPSDPTAGEGEDDGDGTGGTPPPPSPGDEITPDGDGDTDFGDPPEGERWVGCCLEITASPIGSGSIPDSAPYLIYPRVVGNARLKLSANTVDSPCQIRSQHLCLWESIEGQSPSGVFVNLLPNYSYKVTPYSVPVDPPPENA